VKIKTSELTGAALDWAVAKALGRLDKRLTPDPRPGISAIDIGLRERDVMVFSYACFDYVPFAPSFDWAQGGPIIERKEIGTKRNAPCSVGREWEASPSITAEGAGGRFGYGPTPLVAAMRCCVASELGDEVDIPKELL